MEFHSLLERARNGGGILFCGAGFSADCLNFEGIGEIGTSGALLALIDKELCEKGHTSGFKDLKNAADEYRESVGEYELMRLLKKHFSISNVTDDMIEIVKFPWDRIYTTNFDNAIEMACTHARRSFDCLNNMDHDSDISTDTLKIIHLHGSAFKWDIDNFGKSCILGAESYLHLDTIRHWLDQLRSDVDRAIVVAFVGFSASDLHLNQVLYNASGIRSKIFFVNRVSPHPEPDLERTQRTFGESLPLGRTGFTALLREVAQTNAHSEPVLRCYRRYQRPDPSPNIPSVTDIENQLIFGECDRPQIVRDILQGKGDYHVPRTITREILNAIERGSSLVLISGEICDGKTIVLEELCVQLSLSRPIFELRHSYDDLLKETTTILDEYKNPIVIIENCFDLSRSNLRGIARQFDKSHATAIVTSRTIAMEGEITDFSLLNSFETFNHFPIGKLNADEIGAFIDLTDQIAAWRNFRVHTHTQRINFVERTCSGSLPGFLLRLLRSKHVKDRYIEEYRKTESLNPAETHAAIAALYVAHIGYDAPLSFLSDVFERDVGAALDRLNRQVGQGTTFKLIRREGDVVKTVPSIGATNLLKEIIEAREVVDTVVEILKKLSTRRRNSDFARHMFTQMMRYSILSSVIDNPIQINRFFDNVSKITHCRRQILFWLQWHMAMTDQRKFVIAERYLKQAYTEARNFRQRTGNNYDNKQIDDRRAKFLMFRGQYGDRSVDDVFHDFLEACRITKQLLNRQDLTHHPYETLGQILEVFEVRSNELTMDRLPKWNSELRNLGSLAAKRFKNIAAGYQCRRARQNLERLSHAGFVDDQESF